MVIYAPIFKKFTGKLVFFVGPIQGAYDYHEWMINYFAKKIPSLNIATPKGDYSKIRFKYNPQVDWESYYLKLAAKLSKKKLGGIIMWLGKEKTHHCDRSYAQTTRYEVGEWITKYIFSKRKIRIFIGIEPGFTGARYIKRRLSQDCPEIKIHRTLTSLCKEVVQALG